MLGSYKIALVVMESRCGAIKENLKRICEYIKKAGREGAKIVVFPEAALTGYCPAHAKKTALLLSHPAVQKVRQTAAGCGITALVGLAERDGEKVFISQLMCGGEGALGVYRKTHLGPREKAVFCAGDSLDVFFTPVPVGICICYDIHFPEATAALRTRGAKILAAPHASPKKAGSRAEVWARYMPARAYDNRMYVACCNACGRNGCGVEFSGGAVLYAPDGSSAAADFSGNERMLTAVVEPVCFEGARDFPQHRRPELYF
jgi:predicted amidohydrolase